MGDVEAERIARLTAEVNALTARARLAEAELVDVRDKIRNIDNYLADRERDWGQALDRVASGAAEVADRTIAAAMTAANANDRAVRELIDRVRVLEETTIKREVPK
jgi:hypothetical protein